ITGVAAAMMMAVFERTREIGTLLCLGFHRRRIVQLFLCEAAVLGVFSGATGAALGCGIAAIAARVGVPFSIPGAGVILNRPALDGSYVALALTVALFSAILAGLYPAFRAARLVPVSALRAT